MLKPNLEVMAARMQEFRSLENVVLFSVGNPSTEDMATSTAIMNFVREGAMSLASDNFNTGRLPISSVE